MGKVSDPRQSQSNRDLRRYALGAAAKVRALSVEMANDFTISAEDVETCRDAADVIEALLRETAR